MFDFFNMNQVYWSQGHNGVFYLRAYKFQSKVYTNIETERLLIRPINVKDANFIIDLVNSKGWLQFIGDRNVSTRRDAESYIQRTLDNQDFFYNVFELKKTRKAIGIITFLKREDEVYPDMGFALLPEFEKKGYALEASTAYFVKIKSIKKFDRIIAITMPENIKSIGLLRKLGFQYMGDFRKRETLLSYYSFIIEKL
ncbi:MAG: GNAT family N-acetyltransferase [Bacteroidota bacterium]